MFKIFPGHDGMAHTDTAVLTDLRTYSNAIETVVKYIETFYINNKLLMSWTALSRGTSRGASRDSWRASRGPSRVIAIYLGVCLDSTTRLKITVKLCDRFFLFQLLEQLLYFIIIETIFRFFVVIRTFDRVVYIFGEYFDCFLHTICSFQPCNSDYVQIIYFSN